MNYEIDYNDPKFQEVEKDKKEALTENENVYNEMVKDSDKYYQDQIDAANKYAEEQKKLQQDNTDFAIEQINQQKEQANKDYKKEQSGAYVDWQKQSNQYGANAEAQAAQGLTNSGYSESSQVSMYNTYQNRITAARETYNKAVLNYDNAIKDAQLQNNSKLAEIAYKALQTQLELSLQGFQYKNTLILEQMDKKREVEQMYYERYKDVLNQMNTENAMAEQIRQYNENLAMQKEQFQEEIRQYNQDYELKNKQYNESIRQFNEEIARLKAKDAEENAYKIKQLELQKQQLAEQKRQADLDYQYKQQQLAQQQRQWEAEYNLAQQKARASTYSVSSAPKAQVNTSSSSSKSSSTSKVSTTEYNKILSLTRIAYNAARKNKKQAAEELLAASVASGKINKTQANKILKQLGIK